jgi:hypothetical protein
MPANSIWIDAPAVPFGFYRGWWLGCSIDSDQRANKCVLYKSDLHPPIVYEGRYLPCDGKAPVPVDQLKLKPCRDGSNMWVFPGVIVLLQDGRFMLPEENLAKCDELRVRLEERHEVPPRAEIK